MENTVNEQANGTVTASQDATKTFTQDEVNQIVADRLKREGAKYTDYKELKDKAAKFDELQEASKSELQKATEKAAELQRQVETMTKEKEVREIREKVAKETGVPASLLMGDTEETCKDFACQVLAFKNNGSYPSVKDGGELQHTGTKTTADEFADWFNQSIK